jgi:hydroxyacylglutathione hydrolase
MSEFVIRHLLVLTDNYVYLLHEPASGATAVVDPAAQGRHLNEPGQ